MELKARIKNVAYDLVTRYSITSVTMDMIAKECGISKRTLYENFSDKRSLIIEAVKGVFEERNSRFQDLLASSDNKMIGMLRIYSLVREFMSSVSQGFFIDIQRLYPELKCEYKNLQDQRVAYFQDILQKGSAEGVFRSDFDFYLVASLYMMQMQGIKEAQNMFKRGTSIIEVYDTTFLMYFRGIATTKGLEIIEEYCKTNNYRNNILK